MGRHSHVWAVHPVVRPATLSGPDPLFPLVLILVLAVVIVGAVRLAGWLPRAPGWFWGLVALTLGVECLRDILHLWTL